MIAQQIYAKAVLRDIIHLLLLLQAVLNVLADIIHLKVLKVVLNVLRDIIHPKVQVNVNLALPVIIQVQEVHLVPNVLRDIIQKMPILQAVKHV